VSGTAGTPPVGAGATGTTATGSQATGSPSPASTTAGAMAGYRLTGADVQPFAGQRVQVVGTFAPAAAGSATGTAGSTGAAGVSGSSTTAMPEFRVVTIRPIGGPCQQQ